MPTGTSAGEIHVENYSGSTCSIGKVYEGVVLSSDMWRQSSQVFRLCPNSTVGNTMPAGRPYPPVPGKPMPTVGNMEISRLD